MKGVPGSRRLCFILNPFAGAGGPRAWKGTDWPLPLEVARRAGPEDLPAWGRAERFARAFAGLAHERGLRTLWLAPQHPMGSTVLERAGLSVERLPCPSPGKWPTTPGDTAECTRRCAPRSELVVFVGGDGTARIVAENAGGTPILGVPAGVKVYSAVFASSPEAAAEIVADFLEGRAGVEEREILDIDEEAFRRGRLSVKLWGYHPVPVRRGMVVSGKSAYHPASEIEEMREIAEYVRDEVARPCTLLILGPGRTVYEIARALGVEKTMLGVDAVHNGRLVGRDLDEEGLARLLREGGYRRVLIVVSPIGGQGFILGRGNQQISPRIIRMAGGRDALLVVATPTKLRGLDALRVDTGDPRLDEELRGYVRVLIGYNRYRAVRVV